MADLVRTSNASLSRYGIDQADVLSLYLLRYDRPQTKRAYRNDLVQFFLEAFDVPEVTLDVARQVTFVDVNAHLEHLERAGAKASTIRRRLSTIRGFFDWLMAMEVVSTNPASRQLVRRIQKGDYRDRPIKVLTLQQARLLLEATAQAGEAAVRDQALLRVMMHCVLRRSEVARMDVAHIRQTGPYWILDLPETKGGADQFVKIPALVVEEVHQMQRHYGISEGPLWRSLSSNGRGKRLSPAAVYELVKRTAKRAGLTGDIGAHTLRHTGCTLAIEAGATIQQVQTHARHKNIDTTLVYVHQRDKLKNSAADHIHI